MDKVRYFIKEAFKSIWANRMMSLASIGILFICLLLLGSSLLVSFNIKNLIEQIENQNQIMVFVDTKLDSAAVQKVGEEIGSVSNVKQSIFISKQEALEQEKKSLGQYSDLLKGLENDNPLPDSFRIVLTDMGKYRVTVDALKNIKGVTDVRQNAGTADKLNKINRVVGIASTALIAILAVVAMFIMSNTIKMAVYVRKREVNIMKFVGATDWFIRWPFIFEGMIIGLVAGLVAFGVQIYVYNGLFAKIASDVQMIHLVYYSHMFLYFLLGFLFVGMLAGTAASAISMRKYLRV